MASVVFVCWKWRQRTKKKREAKQENVDNTHLFGSQGDYSISQGRVGASRYPVEKSGPFDNYAPGPGPLSVAQLRHNNSASIWRQNRQPQKLNSRPETGGGMSSETGMTSWPSITPGLHLPPPRAPSVAFTEGTSRTSGTWNTWGIEQHRDKK